MAINPVELISHARARIARIAAIRASIYFLVPALTAIAPLLPTPDAVPERMPVEGFPCPSIDSAPAAVTPIDPESPDPKVLVTISPPEVNAIWLA